MGRCQRRIAAGLLAAWCTLDAHRSIAADLNRELKSLIQQHEGTPGLKLRLMKITEERVVLGFEFPTQVNLSDLPTSFENLYENAVGMISAIQPAVSQINLLVSHPNQDLHAPLSISKFRPKHQVQIQDKSNALPLEHFPHGQSLRGRTIAISPGHGWIYYDRVSDYRTQRSRVRWDNCGSCRGIVEDFETHEIVVHHLIPLLEGAGARVVLVRERSHQDLATISDNRDPTFQEISGQFNDGSSAGGHGDNYRFSSDADAEAEWTLTAPTDGEQLLSLWFVHGQNRFKNAKLEVQTPGALHKFSLDQSSHGRRWAPIHKFVLQAEDQLVIRLQAPVSAGGGSSNILIADAVRLGAGKHSTNHPWWEMGSKPFAAHQNAPANIQSIGDVSIRPIYAEWFDADIYISIHSNASGQPNSTAAGTSTYRYNCGQSSAGGCDDPPGSIQLQSILHNTLVSALQTKWDENWVDRGVKTANFGELRNLDDMPGVLLETAFHDNVRLSSNRNLKMTDNQSLHDPRWRDITAYAIYQGISEYFDASASLIADAPKAIVAKRMDADSVEVSFSAASNAMSYRVYSACGHPDLDQGQIVSGSPALISGLKTEAVCFFKVASLNAAGEGLASAIVSARPSKRPAQILIVDAFQRLDAWVERRDNRNDTARRHGQALASTEFSFDAANEAALLAGLVRFDDYDGVVLALGRESTEHDVLTLELRMALSDYRGAIFASGSEIAWALDERGDAASRAFLLDVFGVAFGADDSGVLQIHANSNDWFQNISTDFELNDATSGGVEARSGDVLLPQGSASIVFSYAGPNAVAGVRRDRNLILGFALDSIQDEDIRAQLLSTWAEQAVPLVPIEIQPDAGTLVRTDASDMIPNQQDAGGPPIEKDSGDGGSEFTQLRGRSTTPIRGTCACDNSESNADRNHSLFLFLVLMALAARRSLAREDFRDLNK
jgi:N-acetylmuramoyl-L-alanine amidase